MFLAPSLPVSGHIFKVARQRGPQWYAKWRDESGQHQRRLGPAWTGRGRPREGYFTKMTAKAALDAILADARRGQLTGQVTRTKTTFGEAAAEYLRWIEHDRQRKRSTLDDYRSAVNAHLLPAFGSLRLDEVTAPRIDAWRARLVAERRLANKTINKLLAVLHGIFERARKMYGLAANPVAEVEKQPLRKRASINVFSGEEVHALVRAAENEQDGAIFLTAAFTGLRMGELVALRWRGVDFEGQAIHVRASYTHGALDLPKSGKGRMVPMIDAVATALARLAQRERFTGADDLVFAGLAGNHLDHSALRRRYTRARGRAELRALRFHDLRHTFGTHAIRTADPRELQHWMGHASFSTTEIYLSYKPQADAARRLGQAFEDVPVALRGSTSDARAIRPAA
jgi:integrase